MTSSNGLPRVGVVGLGRMGSALLERVSDQGFVASGWNRSPVSGANIHADIGELAVASDVIMLSLFDDTAVAEVAALLCDHDLGGKLIVDTSTTRPDTMRDLEPALRAAGAHAIDAPIAGGPDMVLAGTVGLYIGGAAEDVERFHPVAETVAARVLHVGGLGAGATAKIFNNMMLCGYWQVLKEAMLTGQAGGLDYELMLDILSGSPAASPAFIGRLPVLKGESDMVGFSLNGVVKDAELFTNVAQSLGVEIAAVRAGLDSFRSARDNGFGADDLAQMVRTALTGSDPADEGNAT